MHECNRVQRYSLISRCLHWVIAALIVLLIWLGWYLVGLGYYDAWFNTALHWHRALGLLVLVLAVWFWVWRWISPAPARSAPLRVWERAGATLTHGCLLLLMVFIPLTGYLISTSAGEAVPLFGEFAVPALARLDDAPRDVAIAAHLYLAYTCAALVLLHGSAALKHHFFDRDDTLRKML